MTQTPEQIAASLTKVLVSDAEIEALVVKGWDWHSAYRHLQSVAHSRTILENRND